MRRRNFRTRGTGPAGWMTAPGMLGCYFLPLGMTFGYALVNSAFDRRFAGLSNFRYLLSNRYFLLGCRNTLEIGGEALGLGMAIILIIGFLLDQHPRLLRRAVGILLLPLLMPSVSAVSVWKTVFHTNTLLPDSDARAALTTLFLWQHTGIGALLLAAALRSLPRELMDAAALDGAGRLRTFLRIQLPNVRNALAMDGMLLMMFFLRIYKEGYLLFGLYPSENVYLLQHYMNHQYLKMSFQHVAASAVLLVLAAAAGYLGLYLGIRRKGKAG